LGLCQRSLFSLWELL